MDIEAAKLIGAGLATIGVAGAGVGTIGHLCGVLMASTLGFEADHVAYRGGGEALKDLLGGRVDACVHANERGIYVLEGELDVLLSTTIIENGIDISNANTLIVENAGQPVKLPLRTPVISATPAAPAGR